MQEKIVTIRRINFTGKWVEFWWEEIPAPDDPFEEESFHECSKAYMLWGAVEKAGLHNEIDNNGFKGRKLKWVHDGHNYEIEGFVDDAPSFVATEDDLEFKEIYKD